MRTAMLLLLPVLIADAQTVRYGCDPTPEGTAAIAQVSALRVRKSSIDFTKMARDILRPVVRAHPDDIVTNLEYLSLHMEKGNDDIIEAYRASMDAHQSDPRYALFYAASLIGNHTPEALRRLTTLTSAEFPFPYLLIGKIHTYPNFHDAAAASDNLVRFVQACPAHLPAYQLLAERGSDVDWGPLAAQLRALLKGRADPAAVSAYRWLWIMEFRATAPEGHSALRRRVADDIETLDLTRKLEEPVAVATLRQGYRLAGNSAALATLPAAPSGLPPVYEAERAWRTAHPFPGKGSTKEETERFYRAREQAARKWIAEWPDEAVPYLSRFAAMAKLSDTPEYDLVAAGTELIEFDRQHAGRASTTPVVLTVAQAYVDRGIRLDAIPAMIDAGLTDAARRRGVPEYDLFDDRNHRLNEQTRYTARIQARQILFQWAMKTANEAAASAALEAMRVDIDALREVTTQPGLAQSFDADYWARKAQLAERQGRIADAEQARTAATTGKQPAPPESPLRPDPLTGKPLPPFRWTALDGRVWTPADLAGKVAVLNVWATWCAPCIQELPLVQKLHESLKRRPDVIVLTLNVDQNPGEVEPFLKNRGWTFPVVFAGESVKKLLPELGIPRTWVVESGLIRSEQIGFESDPNWEANLLTRIDAAKPKP